MRLGVNCKFLQSKQITGVERYAVNLLGHFNNYKDTDFLLLGAGEYAATFTGANIFSSGPPVQGPAPVKHLWEQAVLPAVAVKSGVDLLLNLTNTAPVIFRRNVIVVHDVSFLEHPEWFSASFARLYRILIPAAVRKAKAVITDSNFSRDRIIELMGAAPEKVHTVYLGIDPVFRPAEAGEIEAVRTQYNIAKRYVLFTGSIAPRKNLSGALTAFRKANCILDSAYEFIIVGATGPQFAAVDATSKGLEHVKLLGYVPDEDLYKLYSGAEAFIYPSFYEGFGLPPLEAMACGAPVISSNAASLPEAVGDAGILVDPKDTDKLTDALINVLSNQDLRKTMIFKGLEHAAGFSWSNTAREVIEVCRRVSRTSKA